MCITATKYKKYLFKIERGQDCCRCWLTSVVAFITTMMPSETKMCGGYIHNGGKSNSIKYLAICLTMINDLSLYIYISISILTKLPQPSSPLTNTRIRQNMQSCMSVTGHRIIVIKTSYGHYTRLFWNR